MWASVCCCVLGPKAPGTALSHITVAPGLFMTTAGEQDPLGTGLLCKLLLSVLHMCPEVLISVLHISVFLLCLSSSLLCIWRSQSGASLNAVRYFSVDMTLAQRFCLQKRCPQKRGVLLLSFAVAVRCVPPQVSLRDGSHQRASGSA